MKSKAIIVLENEIDLKKVIIIKQIIFIIDKIHLE